MLRKELKIGPCDYTFKELAQYVHEKSIFLMFTWLSKNFIALFMI